MNIVLLESLGIPEALLKEYQEKLEEAGHEFVAYERNTDPEVQIARAKDADALMIANMPLTGQVIRACEKLRFIDVAFTGVDHVDLEAAKEGKIAVSNASGYSNESVAELVICMALSLLRNVPQVERRCREGKTKDGLVGRELAGKTVGIIGAGAIGTMTARLFAAFGCKVLAYNRHPKADAPEFIHFVSLSELLEQSDIVSLHCPINQESKNLINKKTIGQMKKGALLINAARGPVVDSHDLAEALDSGRLGGAGIDVFETEPPLSADHPLLHTPNTIVTPHVAFASQESMRLRAEIVFRNLTAWMDGKQENIIL